MPNPTPKPMPIELTPEQKIEAGRLLRKIAGKPAEVYKLLMDPKAYLIDEGIVTEAQVGEHQIVFHVNTPNTTHYAIQFDDFYNMDDYMIPPEYDSGSSEYIDPEVDPEKAYNFRLGDYTFALCG